MLSPPRDMQIIPPPGSLLYNRLADMTGNQNSISADRSRSLLTAAWMAVLLGLAMQGLSLLAVRSPNLKVLTTELVQKVSWSTLVCTGLAIGMTAAKSRTTWMGLAGLIAAPAAFMIARTLQKSLAQTLGAVGTGAPPIDVVFLVIAKAIQYVLFGVVIGRLTRDGRSSALACGLTGLLFGAAMAAVIVGYSLHTSPPAPTPAIFSRGINELIFPVGCALILYASDNVGRRLSQSA